MNVLVHALILTVPLIISGIIHMAVVKANLFSDLKIPIHREWFGVNKTWRGIIVIPLATAAGVKFAEAIWPQAFSNTNWLTLGILLGLAYVVFELPNSFIKRRIGIGPGKRPERHAVLFTFMDQADSAIGCALAYFFVLQLSIGEVILLVLIGPALHLLVNYSLYLLRLRKEPA